MKVMNNNNSNNYDADEIIIMIICNDYNILIECILISTMIQ